MRIIRAGRTFKATSSIRLIAVSSQNRTTVLPNAHIPGIPTCFERCQDTQPPALLLVEFMLAKPVR